MVDTHDRRTPSGGRVYGRLREPPGYLASAEALARTYREGFRHDDQPSVGLEEELILVEPESFAPVAEIDCVLAELGDRRFVPELRTGQIELSLPPKPVVSEARRELTEARGRLIDTLAGRFPGPLPVGIRHSSARCP